MVTIDPELTRLATERDQLKRELDELYERKTKLSQDYEDAITAMRAAVSALSEAKARTVSETAKYNANLEQLSQYIQNAQQEVDEYDRLFRQNRSEAQYCRRYKNFLGADNAQNAADACRSSMNEYKSHIRRYSDQISRAVSEFQRSNFAGKEVIAQRRLDQARQKYGSLFRQINAIKSAINRKRLEYDEAKKAYDDRLKQIQSS